MDKHKQFTKNAHDVGVVISPGGSAAVPSKHFKFSEEDLNSDFTPDIDPTAVVAAPVEVKEAPMEEPVVAPPEDVKEVNAKLSTEEVVPFAATAANMGGSSEGGVKGFFANRKLRYATLCAGVLVFAVGGVLLGKQFTKPPQVINDSSQLDQATLFIDSEAKSVGIKAPNDPSGLQVGADVSAGSKGVANIRMGLIKGSDPSIVFEDSQKNTWQLLGAGGSMEFIQGDTTRAKLDDKALSLTNALNVGSDANVASNLNVKGNTILGTGADNSLTIQASKVTMPNNLSFNGNALMIETRGAVAIGAPTAGTYKLLVGGPLKVNGNAVLDGQILAAAGSAKAPSHSFNNNTNTGMYEPSLNTIGFSANGTQVMQIQQGVAYTVNGANFEAEGYLRAGRGGNNPLFQVARFTGSLDGGGAAMVANGLGTGYARVLTVHAYYKGNGSEAIPMNVDFVNGNTLQISGGIPGRSYRATIIYSQDNSAW